MSTISQLKKLAGESLVYGVSGVLTRFVSVLLVPVYTRVFAPPEYGIVSLIVVFSALLIILIIFGLDNSMARLFYDSEDKRDRDITLNTFLWSCFGTAVLFAVLVIGFRDLIALNILREPAAAPLLLLMAGNLPLAVFSTFTTNVLRMQRRAVATAIFGVVVSLITVSLNVLFVLVLEWGISGIFYAQLLSSFIAAIWTFALFRTQIAPRLFDLSRWREMVAFSLPLVPGSVAFWVVNLSGAYFIQLMSSTPEVGLFYVGSNVAGILAMFTGAFQMAWGPFAYSIYKQNEAKQTYAHVLLAYLAITCLLSLGLMLFAPEVLIIFTTREYADAAWVAGLLAFNHVLIGLAYIASVGPGIAKNNKAFGGAMTVSAGILVALNLVLVPRFGKVGAAVSILLSQAIVPVIIFVHGQKLYPIPYRFGKAVFTFAASFIIGVGGMVLLNLLSLSWAANLGIKLTLVSLFCVLIFFILRDEVGRTNTLLVSAVSSQAE